MNNAKEKKKKFYTHTRGTESSGPTKKLSLHQKIPFGRILGS